MQDLQGQITIEKDRKRVLTALCSAAQPRRSMAAVAVFVVGNIHLELNTRRPTAAVGLLVFLWAIQDSNL